MLDDRGRVTGTGATQAAAEDSRDAAAARPAGAAEPGDGREGASGASGSGARTDGVVLRRRRSALALVGTGALAVAVAYTWRAASGGAVFGYLLATVMLVIALVHLAAWWDARGPLLVADPTGLRLREGRRWTGLRWEQARVLRLTPTRVPGRDARLVVEGSDGVTRQLRLSLVDPGDLRELPDSLRALSGGRTSVVVDAREPAGPASPDQAPVVPPAAEPVEPMVPPAAEPVVRGVPSAAEPVVPPAVEPVEPEEPVAPPAAEPAERSSALRRAAHVFAPVRRGVRVRVEEDEPAGVQVRAVEAVEVGEIGEAGEDAHPGAEAEAPAAPVVGPRLAEARGRVRLSVDELAERTRIRPHVIEAIEVDDFSACGGDVYARGHLRALARALGIAADPLVADYDARYASAPVTARRVFAAELAGPGRALRATSAGPRWSVLIGVVLVLMLLWGLARLLVPPPADDGVGVGDRGADHVGTGQSQAAPDDDVVARRFAGMGERRPVTTRLLLSAAADTTASTPVVVRAEDGSVVFRGTVGPDQPHAVRVVGTASVSSPDAGAVRVRVSGRDAGLLGEPGQAVRTTFGP